MLWLTLFIGFSSSHSTKFYSDEGLSNKDVLGVCTGEMSSS